MANPDQPLPLDQLYYEMRDREGLKAALANLRKDLDPKRAVVQGLEKEEKRLLEELERKEATIRRFAKQI